MKVSILLPYYNDRKFLKKSIESVLAQSFQDFELILVNHATTDECREIAHSYDDPRIVHIDMDKNYGAGTGLITERFLEVAKGEYIKTFCADDIMYKNCLKDLVEYMDSHPEKDFAFGDVEYIDEFGNSKNKRWFTNRNVFNLNNDEIACLKLIYQARGGYLPYIGAIIRAKAERSIKLDKSMIAIFDVALWVMLLVKGYKIGYLNKVVAGYRIHKNQLTCLANKNKIRVNYRYEALKFMEIFFQIDDYKMLSGLFSDNKYIKRGINITKEDFEFIIAYELMSSPDMGGQFIGYCHLYDMLQDETKRIYLEKKFNFSIKDFRQIYSTLSIEDFDQKNSLKRRLYFFAKKLSKILTCPDIRNRKSKQESL